MQLSSHPSAAELAVEATVGGYSLVALNYGQPGVTYVVLPQSGQVQLCYGYATQPAQQVYIFPPGRRDDAGHGRLRQTTASIRAI